MNNSEGSRCKIANDCKFRMLKCAFEVSLKNLKKTVSDRKREETMYTLYDIRKTLTEFEKYCDAVSYVKAKIEKITNSDFTRDCINYANQTRRSNRLDEDVANSIRVIIAELEAFLNCIQ